MQMSARVWRQQIVDTRAVDDGLKMKEILVCEWRQHWRLGEDQRERADDHVDLKKEIKINQSIQVNFIFKHESHLHKGIRIVST